MLQPLVYTLVEIVLGNEFLDVVLAHDALMLVFSLASCMLVILVIAFVFKFLIKLVDR